uniref:Uncharacterized protein n=1 Tax=Denticeps clupeoides TaxID=299321 RepID=A0AAY4D045_9TELE
TGSPAWRGGPGPSGWRGGPGPSAWLPGVVPLGGPGPSAWLPGVVPLGGPGPSAWLPGVIPLGGPGPSAWLSGVVPLGGPGPSAWLPGVVPLGGPGPSAWLPGVVPLGGPGPSAWLPGVVPHGGPGPSAWLPGVVPHDGPGLPYLHTIIRADPSGYVWALSPHVPSDTSCVTPCTAQGDCPRASGDCSRHPRLVPSGTMQPLSLHGPGAKGGALPDHPASPFCVRWDKQALFLSVPAGSSCLPGGSMALHPSGGRRRPMPGPPSSLATGGPSSIASPPPLPSGGVPNPNCTPPKNSLGEHPPRLDLGVPWGSSTSPWTGAVRLGTPSLGFGSAAGSPSGGHKEGKWGRHTDTYATHTHRQRQTEERVVWFPL